MFVGGYWFAGCCFGVVGCFWAVCSGLSGFDCVGLLVFVGVCVCLLFGVRWCWLGLLVGGLVVRFGCLIGFGCAQMYCGFVV